MGQKFAGTPPTANNAWNELTHNYVYSLPEMLNATAQGQTAADMAAAKSAAAVTPIYSQAGLENLQKFALPYAQTGVGVQDLVQKGGAQTQADILSKYGTPYASAYRTMEQTESPEYYKTLGTATQGLDRLINSIDLTGLSGSERAEVERSLGQSQTATGNLGIDNATNAVANAMTFGSKLQAKRDALGQALGSASQMLSSSRSGFNPMGVTANSNTSNMGTNNFTGVQQSGDQAYKMGNTNIAALSGLANTTMQQQWDASQQNSAKGIMGFGASSMGSCCFILLESYGGTLPWWVRKCRDVYYTKYPEVAVGYKRMARWLVPAMRRSGMVRWLVRKLMVKPLERFGGWLCDVPGYEDGHTSGWAQRFWFGIWRQLAKH